MIPENHYICDNLSISFSGENKVRIMPIRGNEMIMINTTWKEIYDLLVKDIKH